MWWGRVMWWMVPFERGRAKPYLSPAGAVPRVLHEGTIVAPPAGIEPATHRLEGGCSVH